MKLWLIKFKCYAYCILLFCLLSNFCLAKDLRALKSEIYTLNSDGTQIGKHELKGGISVQSLHIIDKKVKCGEFTLINLPLTSNATIAKNLKVTYNLKDDETDYIHSERHFDINDFDQENFTLKEYKADATISGNNNLYTLKIDKASAFIKVFKENAVVFNSEVELASARNTYYCVGLSNDHFIVNLNNCFYFYDAVEFKLVSTIEVEGILNIRVDIGYKPIIYINDKYTIFQNPSNIVVFDGSKLLFVKSFDRNFLIMDICFIDGKYLILGSVFN